MSRRQWTWDGATVEYHDGIPIEYTYYANRDNPAFGFIHLSINSNDFYRNHATLEAQPGNKSYYFGNTDTFNDAAQTLAPEMIQSLRDAWNDFYSDDQGNQLNPLDPDVNDEAFQNGQ